MTAPVCAHVAIHLEPMRDTMVELGLVRITLGVGLADTFCDDQRIALFVTHVFAISTLHASSILKKLPAERTSHDVVELLCDEFVAVELVDVFLPLANSTLAVQSDASVEWSSFSRLLGYKTC